ncbi:MAG: NADH-quinone oxidoreductase subunit J [Pseudomonadota bacterium]|nr:NADH-quinone oxidoreductase subunit J [Pseudomonadota bacterium]
MTFLQLCFYLFAAVTVVAAAMVVTVKNPVKAALFLVLTFVSAACVWVTLEAEFLAIVLILVYVGAVMVLFLFVIMMLDIDVEEMRAGFTRYLPLGLLIALIVLVEVAMVMGLSFGLDQVPPPPLHGADYSNTRELGGLLYTEYVYPFEIAALILLVAIIAAIALTLRRRPGVKTQRPAQQMRVSAGDRLRVVKMEPAPRDDAEIAGRGEA